MTAKTVGALVLLAVALPFNGALTAAALVRLALTGHGAPPSAPAPVGGRPRTVLISGGKMTKALQLARSFHAAGHRVVLVETAKYRLTGHRFSRAVDRFHCVPPPDDPDYAAALLRIVIDEAVDVYVPVCSPLASWHDARAREVLAGHCEVLHLEADMVSRLDDKHEFARMAESVGLRVPDTHRVTHPAQVTGFDFAATGKRYILKRIAYDPVRRLDLTRLPGDTPEETAAFVAGLPIGEDNPWILQEFIPGTEYCTHSTVRDGTVQVHCCCPSAAFLLNYTDVDKPAVEAWVRRFVAAFGLTGQVSFDFMEAADGEVYAIECNPRTHSAVTLLHHHPGVSRAYLESGVPLVRPLASSRPTYWLYHELWRLVSHPTTVGERVRTVARGRDAIFDWSDPLPFLMAYHAQIPSLLLHNLWRRRPWVRIDFNIGKLVEAGGD